MGKSETKHEFFLRHNEKLTFDTKFFAFYKGGGANQPNFFKQNNGNMPGQVNDLNYGVYMRNIIWISSLTIS